MSSSRVTIKKLSKVERIEDFYSFLPMSEMAEIQSAFLEFKRAVGFELKDIEMYCRRSGKRGLFLCDEFRIFVVGYLSHRLRGVDGFSGDAV